MSMCKECWERSGGVMKDYITELEKHGDDSHDVAKLTKELEQVKTQLKEAEECLAMDTIHSDPDALGEIIPIAEVVNNNQEGWTNIIETKPNVTLDIGALLYLGDDVHELMRKFELEASQFCGCIFSEHEKIVCPDHTKLLSIVEELRAELESVKAENERLRDVVNAARAYVTDSYRPDLKYDAERFDRLVDALAKLEQSK